MVTNQSILLDDIIILQINFTFSAEFNSSETVLKITMVYSARMVLTNDKAHFGRLDYSGNIVNTT